MISSVAELYRLHPQTLRLYERVGLLKPSRSQGNTRLYTDSDLERLEVILTLTREMGVNLAGIEIILNMREKMAEMQRQMQAFTVRAAGTGARPAARRKRARRMTRWCGFRRRRLSASTSSRIRGHVIVDQAKIPTRNFVVAIFEGGFPPLDSRIKPWPLKIRAKATAAIFTFVHFHTTKFFHRRALAPPTPRAYAAYMARPDCPLCSGTGWQTVDRVAVDERTGRRVFEGKAHRRSLDAPKLIWAVPCDCTGTDRAAQALVRARIPRRYEHCDFDNFDTDLYGKAGYPRLGRVGPEFGAGQGGR